MLELLIESKSPRVERGDLLGIFTGVLKVRDLIVAVFFTGVATASGQCKGEELAEDKRVLEGSVLMAMGWGHSGVKGEQLLTIPDLCA
jgi:hypothetical protein